jgi:hypothetical protein
MHYFTIILALATAAWAIDLRSYLHDSHCHGRYGKYIGANPDLCYYMPEDSKNGAFVSSFAFYAIPKDWRLSTRSYGGKKCKDVLMTLKSDGATWLCHGDQKPKWEYSGAGYSFINDKEGEAVADTLAPDNTRDCQGPDAIVFEDGETYEFKDVDAATVKTMVSNSYKEDLNEDTNSSCSEKYPTTEYDA